MDDTGGNKRRAAGADEEREQLQTSRGDIGGAACKKVFTRGTPKWIPHATVNKPASSLKNKAGNPAKMLEHSVERLQTISDSQRKFAAQFSLPAADRPAKGAANSHPPGGSRWASKSRKPPKKPGGSPVGSRWSVKPQPPDTFASHEPVLQLSGGVTRRGVQSKYGSARQGVDQEGRLRVADQAAAARSERGGALAHHAERELGRENGGGGRGGDLTGGRGNEGQHQHCTKAESNPAGGLVKGPWTREEDQKIIDCITNNITRWSEIAERVEGRVGKQCRERWFNHLDPTLKKSSWMPAEDEILVQGQARFGNSWTKIAKLLPGRSENAVKNRWNSAARKKGKTESQNNAAELAKMAAAVSVNGSANPDFMGFQQLAMLPDRGLGGPMHYVMVPSFPVRPLVSARQIKPPSVAGPGWPAPSADMNGHMLQFMHAGMPLNVLQGFPVHHHRPDQHAAEPDTSRALGSEGFREQAFGHMATAAPHIYGQPPLPPASVLMAQRMPLGVGSHSRPFSVPMPPLSCDVATGSEGSLSTGARAGGHVATRRDLLGEGPPFADPKGDSLCPEDDLSLSNILFNLSLEQNSLGGLACSFGRADDGGQDADTMDAPFGGQRLPDASNGRPPAPGGLAPGGDAVGMAGGVAYRGQELNGHAAGSGLPEGHQRHASVDEASKRPRLDATTSVPELLFAPAKARTGERPYYSRSLAEGCP